MVRYSKINYREDDLFGERQALVTLFLPKKLREKYRRYCSQEGVSMSTDIRLYIIQKVREAEKRGTVKDWDIEPIIESEDATEDIGEKEAMLTVFVPKKIKDKFMLLCNQEMISMSMALRQHIIRKVRKAERGKKKK